MLFNSINFIFLFLPIVLFTFFFIGKYSHYLAAFWLAFSSLIFYGIWNYAFVFLLIISISANYTFGYTIGHIRTLNKSKSKILLITAITFNLLLLCYYKYTNFFISSINQLTGINYQLFNIVLPLGISFFTFTQIAFLVDVYKGIAREYNFAHYLLFVTYFPHLIAGPVLHHKQMMPQFSQQSTYKINYANINIGVIFFSIGLFIKVVFADQFALSATSLFNSVDQQNYPNLFNAWIGVFAYTMQLYFDFSGYTDMAIGISRMFNINLPFNFNSPYKATSIIDFWRRWHMTLSTFLKDYLYIPLGGNRCSIIRRYINLMITMLLGGLWHGAAWTFFLWGGLHGIFLVINHIWTSITLKFNLPKIFGFIFIGRSLTFLSVVVAWVFFRASSIETAKTLLESMIGLHGYPLPHLFEFINPVFSLIFPDVNLTFNRIDTVMFVQILLGFAIIFFTPNSQELIANFNNVCLEQKNTSLLKISLSAMITSFLFFISLLMIYAGNESEFLYFQF